MTRHPAAPEQAFEFREQWLSAGRSTQFSGRRSAIFVRFAVETSGDPRMRDLNSSLDQGRSRRRRGGRFISSSTA